MGDPRIIYGVEHSKPRDGGEKGEGEITVAKRLLENTMKRHGRLVEIVTADTLYAKATFIHKALALGMDVVIRMK